MENPTEKKEINEKEKEKENKDIDAPKIDLSDKESIIDLHKLSGQSEIKNSDIILAILEICTFNKKYNYDCSNNTKAFWERVADEEVLKKIFKSFKSETLRKYWKIIRLAGNNDKYIEIVKKYEKFINNPIFKLLPIINAISSFIQTDENNFEEFFLSFNSKDKKDFIHKEKEKEKVEDKKKINLIGEKRSRSKSNSPQKKEQKKNIVEENKKLKSEDSKVNKEKDKEEEDGVDPKLVKLDDLVNKLMKISKFSKEEVVNALYGTSNNIENAYLYLQDNEKYDKYFFVQTDDYIIKNLRNKGYYIDLINQKGEDLVKERERFLGIK